MTRNLHYPFLTAALVATAALSACQVSPGTHRALDLAPDTLLADRAGGRLFIDDESTPNPAGVHGITTRSQRYIPRHFPGLDDPCEGFVSKTPAMVVVTDTRREEILLSAYSEAELLVVEGPDGASSCHRSDDGTITASLEWPAGTYRIYPGMRERHIPFTYDLVFEDLGAPITLPWYADDSLTVFEGVGQSEEPVQGAVDTPGEAPPAAITHNFDCLADDMIPGSRPAARFAVTEESRVGISALSDAYVDLVIVGPVTEDGRNLQQKCQSPPFRDAEFEAGDYFVFAASTTAEQPSFLELVVFDDDSDIDYPRLGTTPAPDLSVSGRTIQNHYPFMWTNAVWYRDRARDHLLETAPKELFVALSDDADDARHFVATGRFTDHRYRSPDDEERPQAGEVALLLDRTGHILTVDGLIVSVSPDLLVPAETLDEFTFPDDVRIPDHSLNETLSLANRDDRPLLNEYGDLHQNYEFCTEDFYIAADREIEALADDGASRLEIDELVDSFQSQVREECGYDTLREHDASIHERLIEARRERRRIQLGENIERIETLFDR